MPDKQQPEPLRIAALLEKTGAQGSLRDQAAAELRRQHAELETLRAKLKTNEDLGDAGSDVQLLRMGYAAARLEIESLKARPAGALQPVVRDPLPSVEIMRIVLEVERQHNFLRGTTNWATAVGRAVERAHGIGGQHG